MEAFAAIMPTLWPKYLIFPFLAHALGTLAGAFIAFKIVATHKMRFAYTIGGIFLAMGILVNIMIPGPVWFRIGDILIAYLPMAYLGGRLGQRFSKKEA